MSWHSTTRSTSNSNQRSEPDLFDGPCASDASTSVGCCASSAAHETGGALRDAESLSVVPEQILGHPAGTGVVTIGAIVAVAGLEPLLLEREVELERLSGLLGNAHGGRGTVVVVEGAAGIGKSELLAAVRAGAQARGFGVLGARGSEFEAEIAFGVARQLFEPMLRAASPAERRRLLGGVARVGARALGVEAGEPPADRFAAIHGLFWLCANRAERGPLVVVVDDLQWVDDPSLAWLGYLGRRAGDLALLLVVGLRSGDPGGDAQASSSSY